MPRTLLTLGVISAVVAAMMAMGFMRGGGTNVYPMRIVGNSSSGYDILAGDKPLGDVFHVAFDGDIRWDFTNNTNPPEDVRFRLGGLEFDPADCPVNWPRCEYPWPNLPHGQTHSVSATPIKDSDSYGFNIEIGKHPDGKLTPVDPELQIDNNFFDSLMALILALLSALFFGASWWTGRRASRKIPSGGAQV